MTPEKAALWLGLFTAIAAVVGGGALTPPARYIRTKLLIASGTLFAIGLLVAITGTISDTTREPNPDPLPTSPIPTRDTRSASPSPPALPLPITTSPTAAPILGFNTTLGPDQAIDLDNNRITTALANGIELSHGFSIFEGLENRLDEGMYPTTVNETLADCIRAIQTGKEDGVFDNTEAQPSLRFCMPTSEGNVAAVTLVGKPRSLGAGDPIEMIVTVWAKP